MPTRTSPLTKATPEPVSRTRSPQTRAKARANTRQTYATLRSRHLAGVFEALTAAAEIQDPSSQGTTGPSPNAVTRTWEHAAFGYQKSVGELNAAMMYVGDCLARCSLCVGKRNADGSVDIGIDGEEPVEDLDKKVALEASEIIGTMRAKRGGQGGLLRSFGEKMFITGEVYLVPETGPMGQVYNVLSTQELMKNGNIWVFYGGPGFPTVPLPPDVNPIRVWRPDPQYGMLSSSSVRSCLEILEELVILTRLVRSAGISRMATAGVLLIPDELDTPDEVAGPDGNIAEDTNPLATDILNTGAKAIDDPASAAAFMPYILQGPAEFLSEVRHIPFQGEDQEGVIKRDEALQRLAQGLDLPVEVIFGHQSTTFANAAEVTWATFNLHIKPTLDLLVEALTECILWPQMAINRHLDPEHLMNAPYPDDILSVAVTYDARELIARPDRVKEIVEAYLKDETQGGVRVDEFRDVIQLTGDPPDIEEQTRRIDAIRLTKIREVVPAPPSDAAQPLDQAGKAVQPGTSGAEKAIESRASSANQVADEGGMAHTDTLATRIAGAAEVAAERTIDRIGAKLRAKLSGKQTPQAMAIDGVPNWQVCRILGPALVEPVAAPDDLLGPESATLARSVYRWAVQAGVDDPAALASATAQLVVATVRERLYTEEPPAITAEMCARALNLVPQPASV